MENFADKIWVTVNGKPEEVWIVKGKAVLLPKREFSSYKELSDYVSQDIEKLKNN